MGVCAHAVRQTIAVNQAPLKATLMATGLRRDAHAYKPGQLVPISGFTLSYTLVIGRTMRWSRFGRGVSPCRVCRTNVTFFPTHPVTHMTHDFDLAGPLFQISRGRAKAAKRGLAEQTRILSEIYAFSKRANPHPTLEATYESAYRFTAFLPLAVGIGPGTSSHASHWKSIDGFAEFR